MAALLLLLAFLLIASAAGGPVSTAELGTDDATLPYYSSNTEVTTYWQRVLPNSPMPSAIVEHLNTCAGLINNEKVFDEKVTFGLVPQMKGDDGRVTFHWGSHLENGGKVTTGWGPNTNEPNKEIKGDDGRVTFQWGSPTEKDEEKVTLGWGLNHREDDGRVTFTMNPQIKGNNEKITFGWGQKREHDDDHKVTFSWGSSHTKRDDEKVTFGWGLNPKSDDRKVTYQWSPNMDRDIKKTHGPLGFHASEHSNNDHKVTFNWGSSGKEGNDEKLSFGSGSKMENDDGHKATYQWGSNMYGVSSHKEGNDEKVTFGWGSKMENDEGHKATYQWGSNIDGGSSHKEENDEKVTVGRGPKMVNDGHKVTYQWGLNMDRGIKKVVNILGTHGNEDDDKASLRWRSNNQNIAFQQDVSRLREGHHRQVHGTGHNHGHFNLENILLQEATLTPGTFIAPYIEPSVFPAPFLRREIADSIPMTTNNFAHILSMFVPMSHTMAGKIWATLHTCEHPHPLEGEQQACATSIESMVELAASVLGTRDLRAFSSSPDVPVQGFIPSPSSKYMVAAVRAVTSPGEKATTMTCHGMTFPYAVFYCHAVNPTRVYEVTLQISTEEDDAAATEMQVLAVCHLDTSQFDPANPFFVARGLKPGDAAVCHFLSRDSVLWAPSASTQGQGQGQVAAL